MPISTEGSGMPTSRRKTGFMSIVCCLYFSTSAFRACCPTCARDKVGVPCCGFKHHIHQYVPFTWQFDWNGVVAN